MPTPITDDQLFIYAKRAKGKVVVITGTSPNLGNPQADNTSPRRGEWHWERNRVDICETWVRISIPSWGKE